MAMLWLQGQSRIVDPYGTVLVEAPIWGDYLFTRTLDLTELREIHGETLAMLQCVAATILLVELRLAVHG